MNLHEIANTPGFGTGGKAREKAIAKAERRARIPKRRLMAEMIVAHEPDAVVASFGNGTDGKDYHINSDAGALIYGDGAAENDARAIAALWNAYRDGELIWRLGKESK